MTKEIQKLNNLIIKLQEQVTNFQENTTCKISHGQSLKLKSYVWASLTS